MAEGNALETLLKGAGLEKTEDAKLADAVILNTCSVRKSAENRIWGRLSFYHHIKKSGSSDKNHCHRMHGRTSKGRLPQGSSVC